MIDEKDIKNSSPDAEQKKERKEPLDMLDSEKELKVEYAHRGQAKPSRIKAYWRKLMDSTQKKMSAGASRIIRMMSWARGDNWRRGGQGHREHHKTGKK